MTYEEEIRNWAECSRWFQNQLERIKEEYNSRIITRKQYYELRKILNDDWDVNMRALNPNAKFFPDLDEAGFK